MDNNNDGPKKSKYAIIVLDDSGVHTISLMQGVAYTVSRKGSCTPITGEYLLEIASPVVSSRHGWIDSDAQGNWYYTDNPQNTNGTRYNSTPIPRPMSGAGAVSARLSDGVMLSIGSNSNGRNDSDTAVLVFADTIGTQAWKHYPLAGKQGVLIGRSGRCDIQVPIPYISGQHARLVRSGNTWMIADCDSKAGTYLNGRRVSASGTPVQEKDCITLADQRFFLMGDYLVYPEYMAMSHSIQETKPEDRPVILRASIKTKKVKNHSGSGTKELIRDINLEIRTGTLVAMLGTAGAGKSTVMNCLNGMDLAGVEGDVLYRNVDLVHDFDRMKQMIGNVPQQKVFHKTFTPEQEFRLAARKRLPGDTSEEEIQRRVDETLSMLSMNGVRSNKNSRLSGGEQTRVNVGIELVADRDLLCLDEPDQGLSPNYKHELFQILRELAHKNGKTMLTIIHDVSEIDMFDQVIILAKKDGVGRLAFSGSPREAKEFFKADIRDVYALLEQDPGKYIR